MQNLLSTAGHHRIHHRRGRWPAARLAVTSLGVMGLFSTRRAAHDRALGTAWTQAQGWKVCVVRPSVRHETAIFGPERDASRATSCFVDDQTSCYGNGATGVFTAVTPLIAMASRIGSRLPRASPVT